MTEIAGDVLKSVLYLCLKSTMEERCFYIIPIGGKFGRENIIPCVNDAEVLIFVVNDLFYKILVS